MEWKWVYNPLTNKVYQNVAFIGRNKKTNKPQHITIRGFNQDFIGDATDSDKRYSFCIESNNFDCNTVHVNKAPIEYYHNHILSLIDIYTPRNDTKEIKIPLALQQFLTDYLKIKNIVFH